MGILPTRGAIQVPERACVLGMHIQDQRNISVLTQQNTLFPVAVGDKQRLAMVGRWPKGFNQARRISPDAAHLVDDVERTVGSALLQATVGREQVGLFSLVGIEGLKDQKLKGENVLGFYFSYPHDGKILVLTQAAATREALISPTVLAHACQMYLETVCDPSQSILNRVDWLMNEQLRELNKAPVLVFVLGYSRPEAQSALLKLVKGLTPGAIADVMQFERRAIAKVPDYDFLTALVNGPFNIADIRVENLGTFCPPQTDDVSAIWGISLNPLEAYQYLARYMLAAVESFPNMYTADASDQPDQVTILNLVTARVEFYQIRT